jgi:hypothetical protein
MSISWEIPRLRFFIPLYTGWVKKTDTFAANLNNKGVSFVLLTLYSTVCLKKSEPFQIQISYNVL